MPKNRFADVRYRVLDECLRDTLRYYTIYDLAKKCDQAIFMIDEKKRDPITPKQIRNDLKFMESEAGYKAEILSRKIPGSTKHYFRYEDPKFSISNKPLTEEDLQNLKSSLYILQRFGGLHNENWIGEFAARIESLPGVNAAPENSKEEIILFEHQDREGGAEWIVPLYRAIEKKHPLKITYREFGKTAPVTYEVSPYLLKQYNRRWFLLCKSEDLPFITTLPLDRVEDLQPSAITYKAYPDGNPAGFFEDIVGVINHQDMEPETITLEVHEKLLPYIETKLMHESQKKAKPTEDPEWFALELKIKPNYEFYSQVLSHGPRMKITAPDSVKKNLKSFIEKMYLHYTDAAVVS